VVVLTAGKGIRMKSRIPKVLHPVAGRPMLLWTLSAARALEPARVLVVTNPNHTAVHAAVNGQGETIEQSESLGTGHALAQLTPAHRRPGLVVVLYGDTPLLRGETLQRLLEAHRDASPAVTLLTTTLQDPSGYGRIVRGRGGAFKAIVEEKDATAAERRIQEINSGVYCFTGRDLWPALEKLENKNRAREYYLTDVVRLIKGRVKTLLVEDPEEVLGINDRRQLAAAEGAMRRRILDRLMEAGVSITDPTSTFIDADVEIGQDTIVYPFTILTGATKIGKDCLIGPFAQIRESLIGDGARVERAHLEGVRIADGVQVGPFSRLRPGTELAEGVRVGTHAEIKNSRIGPETAVPHFSYLGDCVVGANVNIGAGTITANWDGFAHHPTEIGDRTQVSCDTIFVAPVKVGSDAYTGAGAVIRKDVPEGSLAVSAGVGDQKVIDGWTKRRRAKKLPAREQEVGRP